jgi:hypothetical protein
VEPDAAVELAYLDELSHRGRELAPVLLAHYYQSAEVG